MITFAIVMEKGGVGKTTTVIELAFGLARSGRRVLVVDADPQAKQANGLGLRNRIEPNQPSLYHVMVDEVPISAVAVPSPSASAHGRVDLVPGHRSLERVEDGLKSRHEPEPSHALSRALGQLESERPGYYDYALIDCPPSLGFLTISALLAANYVIIPVVTQQQPYESYPETMGVISRAQRRNPKLKVLGILPTQFARANSHDTGILELIRSNPEGVPVLTPAKRSTRYPEAYAGGVSIVDYDRDASTGYEMLVERVVGTVQG